MLRSWGASFTAHSQASSPRVVTSDQSAPVVLSVNSDVSKLKAWVGDHGLPHSGKILTARDAKTPSDNSIFRFHIPHDNLSFQVNYSRQTGRISEMGFAVGSLNEMPLTSPDFNSRVALPMSSFTINSDSSYLVTLALLPIKGRPYVIRDSKEDNFSGPENQFLLVPERQAETKGGK